ncbi:RidA family protein [Pendulispora albinea]|uniref:Rid family detoxifying hydrolase n=1 Tax=Pendulispora albinea TaxID=2741071 RepID=A0ABZ2M0Y8_9BACT
MRNMTRKAINSPNAVKAGPYSHAVDTDPYVYLSGQTPIDPATGRLIEGSIGDQTRQTFANLFEVLKAGGLGPEHVVKCNVYLTNMADFAAMNEVYAQQFSEPFPARTTIGVAALPLGARVEIELIAKRS